MVAGFARLFFYSETVLSVREASVTLAAHLQPGYVVARCGGN